MSRLTVSLVIPAHNEEKYIGACLEAVKKNDGGKFLEVIVVDNASTDKTAEVAAAAGARVAREPKKGTGYARQRGFLEARGDLVAFIDADVLLPNGWYEKIVAEFNADSKLVCLSGPVFYDGINTWQAALIKFYWLLAQLVYFLVGYMAIAGNLAMRRDALQKMGGFDTSIHFYGDDIDTARRASKFGKVKFRRDFNLLMSGRRIVEQGLFKMGCLYALNFFSEVFFHKPATRNYTDVR